ncbi:MAG TPA: hypothetical protein VMF89_16135, partial [Polyangiales bacterium]|nr:hypothetical protein [Polyangiales bacterium]
MTGGADVMKTVARGSKALFWLGCLAASACGDDDRMLEEQDSPVVLPEPSSLTRFDAERPGANCTTGGQALSVGLDENRDGELQDEEVSETAYVCNGLAPTIALSAIETGDARCPHGGSAFMIGSSDGEQEALACNGAPGAVGAVGIAGEQGIQGVQG